MGRLKSTIFEIVVVGNEILNGSVRDTNSWWLATQLQSLGVKLRRVTVVGDDVREIASAVREAVRRGAEWVITSGGLGPTHDDVTLEGVARAVGKELTVNRAAVEMLKERYERLYREGAIKDPQLTPSRIKMAMMPRGAEALRNNAGSAPGCLVKARGVRIVSLPGVPRELMDIFENEVKPRIEREAKRVVRSTLWIEVRGVPESVYARGLERISRAVKGHVYIKSHPQGIVDGVSLTRIEVLAEGVTKEESERFLADARGRIVSMLQKLGAMELRVEGEPG